MRTKRKRALFISAGGMLLAFLSFYTFQELYYYRDQKEWVSPLPSEKGILIRQDSSGGGEFGAKRNGGRRHQGIDLLAEVGTPVYAVRSGWVRVGEVPRGMGKFVTVTHRKGLRTLYGHLSEVYVRDHRRVRQGELIGAVGKTGNAAGRSVSAHLHFELRQRRSVLDPNIVLDDLSPSAS